MEELKCYYPTVYDFELWEFSEQYINIEQLLLYKDNDNLLFRKYLNKIMNLIMHVQCKTYEQFIDILITLEDLIYEHPFNDDETKHNEYVKIMEYRIQYMSNNNNKVNNIMANDYFNYFLPIFKTRYKAIEDTKERIKKILFLPDEI